MFRVVLAHGVVGGFNFFWASPAVLHDRPSQRNSIVEVSQLATAKNPVRGYPIGLNWGCNIGLNWGCEQRQSSSVNAVQPAWMPALLPAGFCWGTSKLNAASMSWQTVINLTPTIPVEV
jgi:hypothetical protein